MLPLTMGLVAMIGTFLALDLRSELSIVHASLDTTPSSGSAAEQLQRPYPARTALVEPYLVKDIWPGSSASSLSWLANVNGMLFFSAHDGSSGRELWKSDGTLTGTILVKDINPGGNSSPTFLTNVSGTLFFRADDGSHGTELWKSDGTLTGTVMVKDINPGNGSSDPYNLTDVNGTLFFGADDSNHGTELWKSDGTLTRTVMVKDINPGNGSSSPSLEINMDGMFFFQAYDDISGYELWKSDGTPTGTVMVKDIWPGNDSPGLFDLTNVNGTLFFQANDGSHGAELWKSDGTPTGTVMVEDIWPGSGSSTPGELTIVSGTLFFVADDGSHGQELWALSVTLPITSLTVTKHANPSPVQAGTQLTYTIRITNTGNVDLHATITDTLPAQLTSSETSGGTALLPSQPFTWTTFIPVGNVWTETVVSTVAWGYTGTLTNVVKVSTVEGATGDYTTTSQVQITPALAVTKDAVPDPVRAGAQLTYTLRVTNTGNIDLHATITDMLPVHVTPGGTLTWTDTITAPGGVWTRQVAVAVAMGYSGTLTNRVQVTTAESAIGEAQVVVRVIGYQIYLPLVMKQ